MRPKQLYLHTSNRIEVLAQQLVETSRVQPLGSLLDQETVMTLNPGMARWLRFEIAKTTGVAFGWDFPFPGKLFQQILSGFEPSFESEGVFDENQARWELFDLLGTLEDEPRFHLLKRYCEGGPARRLQLADRLTRLFDQYLLYRPEAIIDWEAETQSDWQGELWKRLLPRVFSGSGRPKHIARIWQQLRLAHPERLTPNLDAWPVRLSLFGVSSLPPLYLDLLEVVSRFRPVSIYLLQPSDLYWADLKSPKQILRATQVAASRSASSSDEIDPEDLSFYVGNPLLPSFGKQGQAFLDLILDRDPIQNDAGFHEPNRSSQLDCLQADLFTLENRSDPSANPSFGEAYPQYDGTIQIHSCSSPRREVESLWDYLVAFFESHPEAQPSDILVMAPDIQDYAGHIDAVFSNPGSDAPSIPFSIADQSGTRESAFLAGLLDYLELPSGRATANDVASLLNLPLTREVFGYSENEIERILFWIRESKVVWGWDAVHRESRGAFATNRSSWAEFRNRTAADIAFDTEARVLPSGIAPFGEIEGEAAELAGRFLEFLEFLEELKRDLDRIETVAFWNERLATLLDRLKPSDEIEQRHHQSAMEIVQQTFPAQCKTEVAGQEAVASLTQALEERSPSSGYLSGRVTFCSLKPMRSIPAKAICLLGMNSDRFPRKNVRPAFDLLASNPKRGDRNTRDEDKQFFLETLLSARERLFISYQGVSPSSDAIREPSIVVAELLDYLKDALGQTEFEKIRFDHKRQSYDPEYFSNKRLFSYSTIRAENCQAYLKGLSEPETSSMQPRDESRPATESIFPSEIELDRLLAFFRHPQKAFAQETLGLSFPRSEDELPEFDALAHEPLSRYELRKRFAERIQAGLSLDRADPNLFAAQKLLPPGHLEALAYESVLDEARHAEAAWLENGTSPRPEIMRVDIEGDSFRLSGLMPRNTTPQAQHFLFPGRMSARIHLESWIRHLIANTLEPTATRVSNLHNKTETIELPPTSNALGLIEGLVDLYREGLQTPSAFLPKASFKALESLKWNIDWDAPEDFLQKSRELLASKPNSDLFYSETYIDEYIASCLGEEPLLCEKYTIACRRVWEPYLDTFMPKEAPLP